MPEVPVKLKLKIHIDLQDKTKPISKDTLKFLGQALRNLLVLHDKKMFKTNLDYLNAFLEYGGIIEASNPNIDGMEVNIPKTIMMYVHIDPLGLLNVVGTSEQVYFLYVNVIFMIF